MTKARPERPSRVARSASIPTRRSPSTKVVPSMCGTAMSAPRGRSAGSSSVGAAPAGVAASRAPAVPTARTRVSARSLRVMVSPGDWWCLVGRLDRETWRDGVRLQQSGSRCPRAASSLRPMILRMSSLFVRTLRDDPNDAEVPSHRLLVRAGYIRRAAPGIYTWLPLGLRVLRRIENIIRDEMDAIGAQELLFPALLPKEPYEASGRWTDYGDGIFRLQDRKGADYLLGPTHEEMFTLVVKDLYGSYKDLPLSIYQIQTKYRDEARPRAGLLRGREFVMKDSYSFDVDDAGLEASYQKHREAYVRIFDRLGFEYVIVKATSGAMGGSASEEFLAKAVGRRGHLRPLHALRLRRQRRGRRGPPPRRRAVRRRARRARGGDAGHAHDRHARRPPQRGVPPRRPPLGGRRHPQERARRPQAPRRHPRAARHRRARRPRGRPEAPRGPARAHRGRAAMDEAELAKHPALVKGYIGPEALGEESASGIRYLVDPRVVEGTRWVTGANVARLPRPRPGRRPRLHPRRHHRGRRRPRRRRLPQLRRGHARVRARHRDGPHLPARPQVRRGARPQGARRERQAGHRHHGLLRHRPLARRGGDRRGHPRRASGCAGRATSRPPTSTSSPPARTRRSSRPPRSSPPSCPRRASTSCTTTAPARSAPA